MVKKLDKCYEFFLINVKLIQYVILFNTTYMYDSLRFVFVIMVVVIYSACVSLILCNYIQSQLLSID